MGRALTHPWHHKTVYSSKTCQGFKGIFNYLVSLSPAWATGDPISPVMKTKKSIECPSFCVCSNPWSRGPYLCLCCPHGVLQIQGYLKHLKAIIQYREDIQEVQPNLYSVCPNRRVRAGQPATGLEAWCRVRVQKAQSVTLGCLASYSRSSFILEHASNAFPFHD